MRKLFFIVVLLGLFILTACNSSSGNPNLAIGKTTSFSTEKQCPDAEIEWIDMVMIQGIKYEHHYQNPDVVNEPITIEKGKEIGKVTYQMAGNACVDHKEKNGDATFLEVGTPIYEVLGYPTNFLITADDKVYIAEYNSEAKTAQDFFPLNGLVKNIYFESTEDGSRIHKFSQTSLEQFLAVWPELEVKNPQLLLDVGKLEGERVFLEVELNNGEAFRMLYWADTNTFHNGVVGNEAIQDVIEFELSELNK
ncbi:hypothetical protein ACOQFO_11470 [Ureibacillus sp. MALMAid1270]|uniref:hypothetical protein n=1 Tax=Ureibacillus sp. MALMAid1270 TaxID=3411629 RepID=UPI003BA498BA